MTVLQFNFYTSNNEKAKQVKCKKITSTEIIQSYYVNSQRSQALPSQDTNQLTKKLKISDYQDANSLVARLSKFMFHCWRCKFRLLIRNLQVAHIWWNPSLSLWFKLDVSSFTRKTWAPNFDKTRLQYEQKSDKQMMLHKLEETLETWNLWLFNRKLFTTKISLLFDVKGLQFLYKQ